MLGDRRRINRLLKPDRRRTAERRTSHRYTGRNDPAPNQGGQTTREERRIRDRRFVDRMKYK